MAVNSSVEKQPVDQQASGEVQAEIDTRSDGVSPMPNDVSKQRCFQASGGVHSRIDAVAGRY